VTSIAETPERIRPRGPYALVRSLILRWSGEPKGRGFWIFFAAAFCFDFGFDLYLFLFNLFLSNHHFNERFLGIVTSIFTLGNVAGTIPVSIAARRFGLRKILLFCFVTAPLVCILRTFFLWVPAQIGLSFLSGVALSCWPVCFSPVVARLTTESNRVSAFSIVFATGIGSGTLAGLVGGYLPELFAASHRASHPELSLRPVLLLACSVVMLGVWPIFKLQLGPPDRTEGPRNRVIHPFLFRFLPAFALWSVVTGSFIPFAAVYLNQQLRIPLRHVGLIFSCAQLAQFASALLAPLLYKRFGVISGIMCTQVATGVAVFALSQSQNTSLAVAYYLSFAGLQYMSEPGFYCLLMNQLPDEERSKASALQNIVSALSQAGAIAITGGLLVRYGYPAVLSANAVTAVASALLLFVCLGSLNREASRARSS
jgi:MFS family permease